MRWPIAARTARSRVQQGHRGQTSVRRPVPHASLDSLSGRDWTSRYGLAAAARPTSSPERWAPESGRITLARLTAGHDPNNVRVCAQPDAHRWWFNDLGIVASVTFNGAAPLDRLTVYRARSAASGSGPTTITLERHGFPLPVDYGAVGGRGRWRRQRRRRDPAQATQTTDSVVSRLTAALAPFGDAYDVGYGAFGTASATAVVSAGTGFTTIDQQQSGEGTTGDLFAESGVNQPAVTGTLERLRGVGPSRCRSDRSIVSPMPQ